MATEKNNSNDVIVRIEGRAGRLTLNRPDALNALSHNMALTIEAALLDWQTNNNVALVLIDAKGDKAFCAGGDVAALYQQGKSNDFASGQQFWRDEYRLNALIGNYSKPYVAVMDGIAMGGGIGISAHGSHRIVTERSMLAMPECAIGLVPDVGGTHLLSQAPGLIGEYLALTGERFNASDALFAGFADYFVQSDQLTALKAVLCKTGDVGVIKESHQEPEPSVLAKNESGISSAFEGETLDVVIEQLEQLEYDWARTALKKMSRSSPLSLLLAFELVRKARSEPGAERALVREFRFVSRVMEHGDFLEGVRAALIDKDRQPKWKHESVAAVSQKEIKQFREVAIGGDPVLHQ